MGKPFKRKKKKVPQSPEARFNEETIRGMVNG
jgi:hypothetical protein